MSVLGMLAWCAAAVSLWLGARRYDSAVGRAYRWLAAGAALYCAGLVIQGILGGTLNPAPGLSFTDLPSLLALAAAAVGIAMLATAEREGGSSPHRLQAGRPGRTVRKEPRARRALGIRSCRGSRTATSWRSPCW